MPLNGRVEVPRPPNATVSVFEFRSTSNDKVTLAGYCPVSEDFEPCRWEILQATQSNAPQFPRTKLKISGGKRDRAWQVSPAAAKKVGSEQHFQSGRLVEMYNKALRGSTHPINFLSTYSSQNLIFIFMSFHLPFFACQHLEQSLKSKVLLLHFIMLN